MSKKLCFVVCVGLALLLAACGPTADPGEEASGEGFTVAATTYPVYLFAQTVTQGADNVTVTLMINQSVGCLHDYTLSVQDMKVLEGADLVLLNGAGLEASMADALTASGVAQLDCAALGNVSPLESCHDHDHDHDHAHAVTSEDDPHIWMDPNRAAQMLQGMAAGLSEQNPENAALYAANAQAAVETLQTAAADWQARLAPLVCREMITFHDGFAYFAEAFDLTILRAIEEESGSEASAQLLTEVARQVTEHQLPAIFTEVNGATASAQLISQETGVPVFPLNLIMSGETEGADLDTYLSAMEQNVVTLLEAYS